MTYTPLVNQPIGNQQSIVADSDTITVTGLDLASAGSIEIEFDLIISNVAAYTNIYGYVNGDTTNTNYTLTRAQFANGGQGFYTSNDSLVAAADPCTAAKLLVKIYRDALGNVKIDRTCIGIAGGSTMFDDFGYINYNMGGVNNVTSFTLVADQTDAFAVGSSYRVYSEVMNTIELPSSTLLHFDGSDTSTTITESSIWDKTWTCNNGAELDTAQKKFGTASAKFNGTNTCSISTPDHPAFTIGLGNFTMECFVRFASLPTGGNSAALAQKGNLSLGKSASNLDFTIGSGPTVISEAWSPSTNTWYHVAACRSAGTLRMFVDGVQLGSGTDVSSATATDAADLFLGDVGGAGGAPLDGWIDEFRFIRTDEYTANFTPPTAPFTN